MYTENSVAAASLPRRGTHNCTTLRSRSRHVILDSKPWSCTNGLLTAGMAFDFGWTVTAAKQLGTGLSGHTRRPVFQSSSATRLGLTNDAQPRLSLTASAGCRHGQGRGPSKLVLAGPVDAASQNRVKGSVQDYPKEERGHLRFACLLEHPLGL